MATPITYADSVTTTEKESHKGISCGSAQGSPSVPLPVALTDVVKAPVTRIPRAISVAVRWSRRVDGRWVMLSSVSPTLQSLDPVRAS